MEKNRLPDRSKPVWNPASADASDMDTYRILLIDLVHLLSSYFSDVHLFEGTKSRKDPFDQLLNIFIKLRQIPFPDKIVSLFCRRFSTQTRVTEKIDYTLLYGNIWVDGKVATAMHHRMGIKMAHLIKRLEKAFDMFWSHGVSTLTLRIPGNHRTEIEQMQHCLKIFSHFQYAFKTNAPITLETDGKQFTVPLALDERGTPDPNLTLLAGLNRLASPEIEEIVQKVNQSLQKSEELRKNFDSIYQAIFSVKNLREKLIRPPIEINTVKWDRVENFRLQTASRSIQDEETMVVGMDMASEPSKQEAPSEKPEVPSKEPVNSVDFKESEPGRESSSLSGKTQLIRLAKTHFGDDFKNMLQGIYATDYRFVTLKKLSERIWAVSTILDIIEEQKPKMQDSEEEVIINFRSRFEQIPGKVLDYLQISEDNITVTTDKETYEVPELNPRLLRILKETKSRAELRHKMRNIVRQDIDFTDEDYDVLAKEFDISIEDSRGMVTLMKGCFGKEGQFLRNIFEKNLDEFVHYENKIFEFIWYYLKETLRRVDRVAFLNSLQLLIAKLKQPRKALKILLTDFLVHPPNVQYSDRNAFILCNQLLRKYNKELNLDIELTPEEVLLVMDGLAKDIAEDVSRVMTYHSDRFNQKMEIIAQKITDALDRRVSDAQPMPLRYLLSLEREIIIFMALTGGEIARTTLRNGLKRYGFSDAEVYRLKDSRTNIQNLLQHLRVLIRGMGRIGTDEDLEILDQINREEPKFNRFSDNPMHPEKVHQIMEWIQDTKVKIARRTMLDTRDTHIFKAS